MYKYRIIVLIFIVINSIIHAQITQHSMPSDTIERSYRLFVPEHYDSDQVGQLIIVLHGGGMTSQQMIGHTGQRFNQLIEEHEINAIVAYPDGIRHGWNDGRIRENLYAYRENIDDVGFLLDLADTLAIDYNINPNSLYVTGFSNGAGMSYRLACERSERIKAIAPVANVIASTLLCEPESMVAVLSIMGDEDPIVPATGGDLFFGDIPMGRVLPLDDTLEIWHKNSDCDGYDLPILLHENDPDDETQVSVIHATDCDTPVTSMIIHGGGHTWAGSQQYLPVEEYGRTSKEIDAGDIILEFFMSVGFGITE
jgi:polyhydroxybutyrate depolymerase